MPLWGNKDNAANSDIAAVIQYNKGVTSANQSSLYKNVTANAFITNQIVGQFGVDTNEIRAAEANGRSHPSHSGWVLRKEGTGLRAGRVTYEVLVATGSIATDGSDDTQFPDYYLAITTQPTSNNLATASNLNFTVAATSTPSGATITYQWQKYNGSSWTNLSNAAGQYFNVTSATFTANNQTANGNVFRALVSTTGANSVASGSATITLHP
jgi:hypothetical protein